MIIGIGDPQDVQYLHKDFCLGDSRLLSAVYMSESPLTYAKAKFSKSSRRKSELIGVALYYFVCESTVARPPLPYFAFTIHNAGRVKIDIYKKVRVWRFHFIRMRRTGRDHLVGCRSPVLGLGPYFCRASAISTLFCKPRILHIISLLFLLNFNSV
jgi:hypothetical protein